MVAVSEHTVNIYSLTREGFAIHPPSLTLGKALRLP